MPDTVPPQWDTTPIRVLAEELNSDMALAFLGDYLSLLPERMARILQHLEDQDDAAGMDAILSLKVTSAMAGALETEAACRRLEPMIRQGRFDEASCAARHLNAQVQALSTAGQSILTATRSALDAG